MNRVVILVLYIFFVNSCQTTNDQILPAYSPIPIKKVWPLYPDILKRAGIDGSVKLSVLINENGEVKDVIVLRSIPIVDSVSIDAVKKWEFKPGTIPDEKGNQVPYPFWFPVSVDWKLK